MKIVVVAPYKAKVLKSVEALEKVNLGDVKLIGCIDTINQVISEERIKIRSEIIDATEEELIIKTKDIIDDDTVIVFDQVDEFIQKKIICNDKMYNIDEDINYFYTIDIPDIKNFIFVSNHSKKRHLDFDDKKKAILSIFEFMNSLGIKKSNVAVLTDKLTKTDILEVNLIRMILKEDVCKNVNILSPCRIDELFSKKYYNNIYDKNINLLIFKNYDITQTFINTLGLFSNNKIAVGGIRIFNVATESMVPEYEVGDVLLVKEIDANSLKKGDDITYLGEQGAFENRVVTHRIVDIEEIDGEKVKDFESLTNKMKEYKVGDRITLKVTNDDKKYERYANIVKIDGEPKIGKNQYETH